ncbi:AAEL012914-PA, partial [Aedes aegypti]
ISREENDDNSTQHNNHHHPHHLHHHHGHGHNRGSKVPFNGYTSEEYLDRLEPNGNIPVDKTYNKRKSNLPSQSTLDQCWM